MKINNRKIPNFNISGKDNRAEVSIHKHENNKNSSWSEQPELPTAKNEIPSSIRTTLESIAMESEHERRKRGIAMDILKEVGGEVFKQAVGIIAGNVVSNLISSVWERIYPDSVVLGNWDTPM